MFQAIVVISDLLVRVMHEPIPLRQHLGVKRNHIVVGHLTRDGLIVDDLVFEVLATEWRRAEFTKCPV